MQLILYVQMYVCMYVCKYLYDFLTNRIDSTRIHGSNSSKNRLHTYIQTYINIGGCQVSNKHKSLLVNTKVRSNTLCKLAMQQITWQWYLHKWICTYICWCMCMLGFMSLSKYIYICICTWKCVEIGHQLIVLWHILLDHEHIPIYKHTHTQRYKIA